VCELGQLHSQLPQVTHTPPLPPHRLCSRRQVKAILASKVSDVCAIVEAVPDLMDPQQLKQSLANLVAWWVGGGGAARGARPR
jgi:hypothetical protein